MVDADGFVVDAYRADGSFRIEPEETIPDVECLLWSRLQNLKLAQPSSPGELSALAVSHFKMARAASFC
jgi:hypothetical protein